MTIRSLCFCEARRVGKAKRAYHACVDRTAWWARRKRAFVLLHHKFCLLCREALLPQQGHRGRFLMRALIKRMRMVAIEFGMWRSGRKGGSPGSIAVG